jgi:phosphoglycolate phosphatase
VYGPDLSSRGYTKASLIRAALEASRALPHLTAMVGDRGEDIAGARDNGVHSIAVAWGYATDGELAAAQPDWIVRSPRELVEYVERAA